MLNNLFWSDGKGGRQNDITDYNFGKIQMALIVSDYMKNEADVLMHVLTFVALDQSSRIRRKK